MKRVKRARAAGLEKMPDIMGAEYLLPALRSIDSSDVRLLKQLITEAKRFLTEKPTGLKQLKEQQSKQIERVKADPVFVQIANGRFKEFYEYTIYAMSVAQDYLKYLEDLSNAGIMTSRGQEIYDWVRGDFERWLATYY